jgi:hypothetical protein
MAAAASAAIENNCLEKRISMLPQCEQKRTLRRARRP